jgi:hypothetical protein
MGILNNYQHTGAPTSKKKVVHPIGCLSWMRCPRMIRTRFPWNNLGNCESHHTGFSMVLVANMLGDFAYKSGLSFFFFKKAEELVTLNPPSC